MGWNGLATTEKSVLSWVRPGEMGETEPGWAGLELGRMDQARRVWTEKGYAGETDWARLN